MSDIIPFDQVESDVSAQSAGVIPFDQVDSDTSHSETRAVANDALTGLGGILGVIDEINPIRPTADSWNPFGMPPLFGLGPRTEEPFANVFTKVAKHYGVQTEDKPETQLGKFLGNAAENAAAAAPFGPAAMAANAVFGGTGGYLGEMIGGPAGRGIGSAALGLAPAGISKLGIIKEIGEQLGPTVSNFPVIREIFGNAATKAAVGRAIARSSDDLPKTEAALQALADTQGPVTQLDNLKTTAELVGDRGLARAEDALQNMIPTAPFKQMAEDRALVRAGNVLDNFDPTITPYETSKALEGTISASAETLTDIESATWKLFREDIPVSTKIAGLDEALENSLNNITSTGALPVEGEAAGLIKRFNNATDTGQVSMGVVQKLRSRALEVVRDTAAKANFADREANKVASALAKHLDEIIDTNVSMGLLPEDVANNWRGMRQFTKEKIQTFAAPRPGVDNLGTKNLEQLALRGQALDNTALLREGLGSPDKMTAHIQAAKAGGQDVTPLYQQALKAELDSKPQSQWANIVNKKRDIWNKVFTAEEMQNLDRNLADIESQMIHQGKSVTSGSATNPRGNVQNFINREKGIAQQADKLRNVGALGGAIGGATYGWKESDTTAGGVANALLYGTLGATAGKALGGAALRASDQFDQLLTTALKDPRKALEAIEAAKPSELKKMLGAATVNAAKASGAKAVSGVVNSSIANAFKDNQSKKDQKTAIEDVFSKEAEPMDDNKPEKKDVALVEQEIDKDPYYAALYQAESGRNPGAKNPKTSASGGFQFVKATAESMGIKDPFDLGQSFEAVKKLTDDHKERFGDDPATLYAAHYLGATVFRKVKKGLELTDKEQAQVDYLKKKALPDFLKIYNSVNKRGVVEA